MMLKEVMTVQSENHTKHINTLCGQNTALLSIKEGATYSYYLAFNRV
jgi:hypothetical protein